MLQKEAMSVAPRASWNGPGESEERVEIKSLAFTERAEVFQETVESLA